MSVIFECKRQLLFYIKKNLWSVLCKWPVCVDGKWSACSGTFRVWTKGAFCFCAKMMCSGSGKWQVKHGNTKTLFTLWLIWKNFMTILCRNDFRDPHRITSVTYAVVSLSKHGFCFSKQRQWDFFYSDIFKGAVPDVHVKQRLKLDFSD